MEKTQTALELRIHGADGSLETFVQEDPSIADTILKNAQPGRLFGLEKIVIAGTHSLTAFVPAKVTRIDFVREGLACWAFPTGIVDAIELSGSEFRTKTHLDDVNNLQKRDQIRTPGEFAVGFLDIEMIGAAHVFLGVEFVVGLPLEQLQRLNLLLSTPSVHFRLRGGGFAALNLAHLIRFTVYPGPPQAPANAWPAHHKTMK